LPATESYRIDCDNRSDPTDDIPKYSLMTDRGFPSVHAIPLVPMFFIHWTNKLLSTTISVVCLSVDIVCPCKGKTSLLDYKSILPTTTIELPISHQGRSNSVDMVHRLNATNRVYSTIARITEDIPSLEHPMYYYRGHFMITLQYFDGFTRKISSKPIFSVEIAPQETTRSNCAPF